MARHIAAGIDIGTRNTRVVIAERAGAEKPLAVLGVGESESRGLRHGYITHTEEAKKSILEAVLKAEKESGIRVRRALVSIGGLSLESGRGTGGTIISRVDGEVSQLDVEKAVSAAKEKAPGLLNKKIIHQVVQQFKLDGKEVLGTPVGMRGMKLEVTVLFISCLNQHLDDLVQAVEDAGIQVEDVAAAPIAASLVTLTKTQRTAGCVLVNIGAETVSLAVFENDKPTSLEVFPIGGTDITNDIALGLKIPLEEAESVKTGAISGEEYPKKKLNEIIEARLSDIFELVEAHLKKIGRNALLPAGIVLTGGGSGVASIEDLAKASLRLPARVAIPHATSDVRSKIGNPAWAVAYGLCILGLNEGYASDLWDSGKTKGKNFGNELTEWFRQFLP